MFDIGLSEIAFILLIGLVVIGPKHLPKVVLTASLVARKIRVAITNFQDR